jgi:hypothetical protein
VEEKVQEEEEEADPLWNDVDVEQIKKEVPTLPKGIMTVNRG